MCNLLPAKVCKACKASRRQCEEEVRMEILNKAVLSPLLLREADGQNNLGCLETQLGTLHLEVADVRGRAFLCIHPDR